ncbi:MAG TPA: hypothetical protein VFW19_11690 [Allosphingosinicella sp.]|nr:hypothetical protein [Allosphingosinicella sp.]
MTQGILYMVDQGGALQRMTPSAPANEDEMQVLVARHPELITDGDGDLLLVRREQAIADSADGGGRWSLDHLFVTGEAVPVLVELKRAVDTRIRREVVGQMLDYAANATAHWQGGRVAEAFAATAMAANQDPDAVLSEFIGDSDPEEFWRRVDSNFKAGRIKLVFVADAIPRELARIVEFLNDQMRADVRAVELRWFSGEGGVTTLSPRIIGETERASAAKAAAKGLAPTDRSSWIAEHLAPFGEATLRATDKYIDIVESEGGNASVASTQGSLFAAFPGADGKPLYPFNLWKQKGGGQLSLSLGYLAPRAAFADERVRQELYDRAAEIFGPLSTRTLNGFPGVPITRLNDPAVAEGFRSLLRDILARGGA